MCFCPSNSVDRGGNIRKMNSNKINFKCILVKSITYAQKSYDILRKKGISSYICRQHFTAKCGCSWCVKVDSRDLDEAMQLLQSEEIKMTGDIYDIP